MRWIILLFVLSVFWFPNYAHADVLEQQVSFKTDSKFDLKGRDRLVASLRAVSDQLYFYVEDEWWGLLGEDQRKNVLEKLDTLATNFQQEIYPGITGTFGFENRPGIDQDTNITVLVHRMRENAKGYFNTSDGYTQFESPRSNEREMVYLSVEGIESPTAKSYLAHEFMHLVYFNQKQLKQKVTDEVWIQEGFAELAPTILGYDDENGDTYLKKRIRDFTSNARDSITEWMGASADYGVVNMFFQYMREQYGEQLFVDALHSPEMGISSFNDALQKQGIQKNFADIFTDWMVAVFLNDCSYGAEYCFVHPELADVRITPFTNFLSSVGETRLTVSNQTKNWAGNWQKISGGNGDLTIEFEGNPHVRFRVPYLVQDASGKYELQFFNLSLDQTGTIVIPDFGKDKQAVILLPAAEHEIRGFDENNPSYIFSWTVSTKSKNGTFSSNTEEKDSTISGETASLLEQIALLQAQVAQLQIQLAALRGGQIAQTTGCDFSRNITYGLENSKEVRCLQEFLKAQGPDVYPEGLVTGNFLRLTEAAVIRFQEKYAADVLYPLNLQKGTGFVGDATRKKIEELIQKEQLVLTITSEGV